MARFRIDWKGGLAWPCAQSYPCTDSRTEGVCERGGRGIQRPLSHSKDVKIASQPQWQGQHYDWSKTGAGFSTLSALIPWYGDETRPSSAVQAPYFPTWYNSVNRKNKHAWRKTNNKTVLCKMLPHGLHFPVLSIISDPIPLIHLHSLPFLYLALWPPVYSHLFQVFWGITPLDYGVSQRVVPGPLAVHSVSWTPNI